MYNKIKDTLKKEIQDFVSIVGIIQQNPNDPQSRRGSNYANIRVALTPKHTRDRNVRDISAELRGKIGLPEGLTKVNIDYAKEGPPQGRAISINILMIILLFIIELILIIYLVAISQSIIISNHRASGKNKFFGILICIGKHSISLGHLTALVFRP